MRHPKISATLATTLLAALLAGCGGGDGEASAGGASLEPIREAPPFALETLEGDSLRLADLEGNRVILMNFWASWCAPCRAEVPDLIELHEAYEEEPFTVLGVTVNDLPRDSRAFAEEMGMNYPNVIGTPAMLERYEVSPWLPTSLLVRNGEIVREWVGPRTRKQFEAAVRVALGKAASLEEEDDAG